MATETEVFEGMSQLGHLIRPLFALNKGMEDPHMEPTCSPLSKGFNDFWEVHEIAVT